MRVSTRTSGQLATYLALVLALLFVTACGSSSGHRGDLGGLQQILATCDPAAPPATWVGIDATGSSASDAITSERMAAVETVATRTAVCGGILKVAVFTASSAATSVLFEGSLKQAGATDNARLLRIPEAVASVMDTVRTGYGPAAAALSQAASDVVGQLRLGGEWAGQLGEPYRLSMVLLTDGFQTTGVNLAARAYETKELLKLADKPAAPKLPGATVTFAGLGRVAKGAPASRIVEGLVTYYTRLCERTEAATCQAVTDFAISGR